MNTLVSSGELLSGIDKSVLYDASNNFSQHDLVSFSQMTVSKAHICAQRT